MTIRGYTGVSFRVGPHFDMPLLLGIVGVTTLGLVNLYSATSFYTDVAQRAHLADIYVSQIYWIAVGVMLAFLVAAIDYRHFERLSSVLYLGGMVALGLVFVFGSELRGASRWIQLGSFSFQPSEFMKIVVILMVARHLHNDPKTEPRTLIDLLIPAGITLAPVAAVMAQPDLGTSLVYMLCAGTMLAMAKIDRKTLLGLGFTGAVVAPLLWNYAMRPYQRARILSFLDPETHKSGAAWHASQSIIAIGNGGLTGEGYMQGTQNQFGFLPEQYSDFPFSVFVEDWGLAGATVLLALYGFVCVWSIHIASQAKDRFGAAVAVGVGAMIFWHVVFNVGMAMGLLPVVGITLPLFSYGGSSVVTILIGLGLLMNVSMRR